MAAAAVELWQTRPTRWWRNFGQLPAVAVAFAFSFGFTLTFALTRLGTHLRHFNALTAAQLWPVAVAPARRAPDTRRPRAEAGRLKGAEETRAAS